MNVLHLLRHAKSSTKGDVDDLQRPLSRRGRETARLVAKHLPAWVDRLDLVLCSSALRTRETLELVLTQLSPPPRSLIEDELYLVSCEGLTQRLRRLDAREANVLLIGHNPGLHELALALADQSSAAYPALASSKFPTAAYARFHVPADWSLLGRSRHELAAYLTPRCLPDWKE